jgi:diacylglycerol kinase family enzyme
VVVVGGDGTVRHAVAAIQAGGRAVPLVPYPGGTVNLMQLEIRQTTDIAQFVAHATGDTPPRTHYSATINDTVFLGCASIGPDSESVARLADGLKRVIGRLAYLVAFAGVLIRWPRHSLRLTVDGSPMECEAFYLAKGRCFAGPWSFAPLARMDEESLWLVTFAELRRWIFLRFALAMLLGRPVDAIPGIRSRRCRRLAVQSDRPLPIQGDGDIVTMTPAEIRVDRPYTVLRPSS